MKILFQLLLLLLSSQVYAAPIAHETLTEIELKGVIGDSDVIKTRKYRISAKLNEVNKLYPENKLKLNSIEVTFGSVKLEFPESVYRLENVELNNIGIHYIQHKGGNSRIEVYLPHGDFSHCGSYEHNHKFYLQNRVVFSFSDSGKFIEEKVWERCKHY